MNINIVCQAASDNSRTGSVLWRLATALASELHATISDRPDELADLNYFVPYITYVEKFTGWRETPVAAYFSHYDTTKAVKRKKWDLAAVDVDLRIATAPMYAELLTELGATALARPPIDHDAYNLLDAKANSGRSVVGVSGFVYKDGRKGEDLVAALARDTALNVEWRAAGQDWPVSTKKYDFSELPDFYRGLDIFLCASRMEGVPMTVLEALACGTWCVIPHGVGLLDELGNADGLYRFEAGNQQSLHKALEQALTDKWKLAHSELIDVAVGLNALAQPYNASNWASDHRAAFEELLYDPLPIERQQDWHNNAGLYVVAFGSPSRKMARDCITSFKEHMPLPVALASDKPLGEEDIFVEQEEHDIGARWSKTKIFDLAPAEWEYVMYLDADTETVADVGFIFDLLQDGWEFVICKNPAKYHTTRRMVRPDNKPECEETYYVMGHEDMLQLNGGVFGFRRNERTRRFFYEWHREWNRYGARDQAALLRALWTVPLRVYVLGNEWNTITRYADPSETAGILHHPTEARRWTGIVRGRTDTAEAWQMVRRWEQGYGRRRVD